MSLASTAGFAARMLGIVVAACIAGELAWAGVEHDAATGMASWQSKNATKQAYREQPGILTCRTTMSIFNELYPQKTTIVNIPPPGERGPEFDLATLDSAVDSDDCTLDTSQQFMWMAMQQKTQARKSYADSSALRPLSGSIRAPVHRTGDVVRGMESGIHRGPEKS
jgi:hypothetical protein